LNVLEILAEGVKKRRKKWSDQSSSKKLIR
jgi:hypothetical protein